MMRKISLHTGIILIAAVSLVACNKAQTSEPEPEPQPTPESYAVGLSTGGDLARGAALVSKDEIRSLGIFGYSTGYDNFDNTNSAHKPDLFSNEEATRTVTTPGDPPVLSPWVYDPLAFWPSNTDEKNTFFAYAPHESHDNVPDDMTVSLVSGTYGYPQIYYKVPETISEQIDLLYSEFNTDVTNINYTSNTANPGHVLYNMKHALIWIRFVFAAESVTDQANSSDPRYPFNRPETYTISEFTMTGGNIYTDGVFNLGTGTWSHPNPMSSAVYRFDAIDANPLTLNAGAVTPLTTVLSDNALMIIPHDFVTSENLTSLSVTYTHDDGSAQGASNTQYYTTLEFPDVKLNQPGYVMTCIIKLSTKGAYIDFEDDNMIQVWDENLDLREIEVF